MNHHQKKKFKNIKKKIILRQDFLNQKAFMIFINRFFSNLKLTTYILSIQSMTICLIFAIVSVISFFQINRFQQYIQAELLESVIQKSIISNIQLLVGESMQLTYMIYTQYGDEVALLNKLFYFQIANKVVMDWQLEDCENAVYLQSYQQCYNGSSTNPSINTIKQFIQLQNQIIPFRQNQLFLGYLNMYIGDEFFYSIQVLDKKPIYDGNLEKIYLQLAGYNLTLVINQVQNGGDQQVYIFYAIPQTKIAFGILSQEYLQPFKNLEYEGLQVRTFIVVESGLILTDSKLEYKGQQFQDISGFTPLQFELIKNFSMGLSVPNQCEQQIQGRTLCLVDAKNNQKLLFSYYYKTEYVQYIINILDANFVGEIREDFNKQFNNFVNLQIKIISIGLAGILVLCLAIQALLIIKLSRPLYQLVEIAQYNFNHNQYKFQTLIRKNNRNQIQQLQDAYFDLINLSKKHNVDHVKQYITYYPSIQKIGLIQQALLKRQILILRAYIKKFIK